MIKPLRIAINAQTLFESNIGGVQTAVVNLISVLGKLSLIDGGAEEYLILAPWQTPKWLRQYTSGTQQIVRGAMPDKRRHLYWHALRKSLSPLRRPLRPVFRNLHKLTPPRHANNKDSWLRVPGSPRYFERLNCDVIHFPYQAFAQLNIPSVYNPHDLLHLRFPQLYPPDIIEGRERIFRAGCHHSETVIAASEWIKQDIIRHYGTEAGKVQVIPWAASLYDEVVLPAEYIRGVRDKYELHQPFALYPAATHEYKNHLRLLDAVAHLRDTHGQSLKVVCSGPRNEFYPVLQERVASLELQNQVLFPGAVSRTELIALYRLAQFVIIPTLFEAASAPIFEAWQCDVPVACSAVTSLPEQVADAALLFDPLSVASLADALKLMHTDAGLRKDLIERGSRRLRDFSLERTARAYRAVYRRAAGRRLNDEEQRLLEWDWMRDPRRLKV